MTTEILSNGRVSVPHQRRAPAPPPRPAGSLRIALALAPGEARRMVLHPITLLGFALYAVLIWRVTGTGPREAFDAVTVGPTFVVGVLVYFSAYLATTRVRRSRSDELLGAVPGQVHERTMALLLGALGPALVAAAMVGVAHAVSLAQGYYLVTPSLAHLAQAPVTVLGGALLGVMVARWAPHAPVAVVVMVAMFAANVETNADKAIAPLGTYMAWAVWTPYAAWNGLHPGSPGWHVAYLLLLCAMAVAGALLRTTARPRLLLAAGAVLTAAAAAAGTASLP